MSMKSKRMFMWDLKEIDNITHQSLSVEPFNLWPTGNCGHVYAASHTQAKRHISGWAMRNTNNHNINILKKSCLGVLVCNRNCRKSDGNVVAVRPAICDKARRKQIGRKCPNSCGGVLVMQQCKGHSGYPVTHFWRHHEDKIFFLGKGFHDHPRPELKLSSEKRKSYIRQPKKLNALSALKAKYSANSSALRLNATCKYNANIGRVKQQHAQAAAHHAARQALNTSNLVLRSYNQQMAAAQSLYSPPPYPYHTLNYSSMAAFQPTNTAPRLVVPECDYYFPSINQEIFSNTSNQVTNSFTLPEFKNTTTDHLTSFNQGSSSVFREGSTMTQTGAASYPVDYSFTPTADYHKIGSAANSTNFYPLSYNDAGENILDLSVPTSIQLDSSWQSDPIVSTSSTSYNQTSANKSSIYPSTSLSSFLSPPLPVVQNDSTFSGLASASNEISLVSPTTTQNHYQKMREEVPMRFKALWDSIHPLTTSQIGTELQVQAPSLSNVKSASKAISAPVMPRSTQPTDTLAKPAQSAPSGDVSLKEMMEIDDLDMGDISNIISVPVPKPMKNMASASSAEDSGTTQQQPAQTLPTLSSFLRGLEYL